MEEITNINKISYTDLIENLNKDKKIIEKVLVPLKKIDKIIIGNNFIIKEETVQSKTKGLEYRIRAMQTNEGSLITLYSIVQDFLVIWPAAYLFGYCDYPYITLIKLHVIDRYAERFLKLEDRTKSLDDFINCFCLFKDPILIKRSETEKVESLMCRIKNGALLGYVYKVAPKILRLNTFVSDVELEEANRDDQVDIRKNSEAWEKVQ